MKRCLGWSSILGGYSLKSQFRGSSGELQYKLTRSYGAFHQHVFLPAKKGTNRQQFATGVRTFFGKRANEAKSARCSVSTYKDGSVLRYKNDEYLRFSFQSNQLNTTQHIPRMNSYLAIALLFVLQAYAQFNTCPTVTSAPCGTTGTCLNFSVDASGTTYCSCQSGFGGNDCQSTVDPALSCVFSNVSDTATDFPPINVTASFKKRYFHCQVCKHFFQSFTYIFVVFILLWSPNAFTQKSQLTATE